jgi:hypothetical protein
MIEMNVLTLDNIYYLLQGFDLYFALSITLRK